jgi:hypothetical protein
MLLSSSILMVGSVETSSSFLAFFPEGDGLGTIFYDGDAFFDDYDNDLEIFMFAWEFRSNEK